MDRERERLIDRRREKKGERKDKERERVKIDT